jgi:glycosyltransferase involved in cell wall biosynthesis
VGGEPLLSATLIVRDEERVLSACLQSLQTLVDEIIVVDTGSTDRSVELALEQGARVFHFAWRDDFAAARNFAIEQASGAWLLYIDADERVRAGDHAATRAALEDPGALAARVRFYPRSGFTAYPEHRLFRRHPHIRFKGIVHETMLPALNRLIAAGGATILDCDLTIDHVGYDGPQTHKTGRYLKLLEEALKCDPERLYLWWHLGCVHRDLGQIDRAETYWREGAARALAGERPSADASQCHIELIALEILRGEDPVALIAEGRRLRPDNHLFRHFEAASLMKRERFADAVQLFAALAEIDPETLVADSAYDKRIFAAAAAARAAECAFRAGLYDEAAQWYRVAERTSPDPLEFRTKRMLAEIHERRARETPAH